MKKILRLSLVTCHLSLVLLLLACRPEPERLLAEAREHWHRKEYPAAAACYEQFLQQQSGDQLRLQGRLELANTYYLNLHDYPRAEFHYRMILTEAGEKAASAEPALAAERRLAELAVKTGRLTQAIDEYEQLLMHVPEAERRELRLAVANLYYDRNDLDQAELEYLKVVEGVPYDTFSEEAYLRIASIHHLFRQQHQLAVPIYETIRANTKKESIARTACYGLAECYAADSQYTVAIQLLKQLQTGLSGDEIQQVRRQIKEYKKRREQMQHMPQVDWSNP